MNIRLFTLCIAISSGLISCNNEDPVTNTTSENNATLKTWQVPAPNTKVASYATPIKEFAAEDWIFSVDVFTNDRTKDNSEFTLITNIGEIDHDSTSIVLPKWKGNAIVKPMIKKIDSLNYGILIGFDPGDGTFIDAFKFEFDYLGKKVSFKPTKAFSKPQG